MICIALSFLSLCSSLSQLASSQGGRSCCRLVLLLLEINLPASILTCACMEAIIASKGDNVMVFTVRKQALRARGRQVCFFSSSMMLLPVASAIAAPSAWERASHLEAKLTSKVAPTTLLLRGLLWTGCRFCTGYCCHSPECSAFTSTYTRTVLSYSFGSLALLDPRHGLANGPSRCELRPY